MKRWSVRRSRPAVPWRHSEPRRRPGHRRSSRSATRPRPLNVEGAPLFGWMPGPTEERLQTAYQLTVSKGDARRCGTAARSRPRTSPTCRTAARRWPTARPTAGPSRPGTPAARRRRPRRGHFETGLTDQGWSGANWIRRVTTGNDSTDDWTLARKHVPGARAPARSRARASTRPRWAVRHPRQRQAARPRRQLQLSDRGASTTPSTPPTRSRPASRSRSARSTTTGPAPARAAPTARRPTRRCPPRRPSARRT